MRFYDGVVTSDSKNSQRRSILLALLLSILFIHLPLFILIWVWGDKIAPEVLSAAEKQNAVIVDLTQSPPQLPIAVIDKPAHEEVPENASVQSLYNSSVKEETVAPGLKKEPPSGQKLKTSPASNPVAKSRPLPHPLTKPQSSTAMNQKPEGNNNPSLTDELKALSDAEKQKEEKTLAKFDSHSSPSPTLGSSQNRASGDFLPNYKIGSHTYLNALANPSIGYFVELKRKFEYTWNPVPALRQEFNHLTRGKIQVVWGVTVDQEGQLMDVMLIRGSGLSGYDSEAQRAIIASAPFSHPPANIMEKDGRVYMAWTFVYYL